MEKERNIGRQIQVKFLITIYLIEFNLAIPRWCRLAWRITWHNSYLYQYHIQMHLEYIQSISLPVLASELGSSSFHWSSVVMANLSLFPPAFGAIQKIFDVKVTKAEFSSNYLRPRNATRCFLRAWNVFTSFISIRLLNRSKAVSELTIAFTTQALAAIA